MYVYPPNQPLVDPSLPAFCFPDGVAKKTLQRTKSNSRINEVRYSNLRSLESDAHSFTFLLTGFEEVLYGLCVRMEEMVDDDPSLLATSSEIRYRTSAVRSPGHGTKSTAALRCYTIVSRFPFFKLHFDFLYTLIAKDRHVRMSGGGSSEVEELLRG
jgi:hypothetical protein